MITKDNWRKYIEKLAAIDDRAADLMRAYINENGLEDEAALINYAYALTSKYGDASATLSCEMYDYMAEMMDAGVPEAIPAATATYKEVASGTMWAKYHSPSQISSIVGRQVRQAGADTMMQNAKRDKAEWAWVPQGDTCAFCITLASRGWQEASKTVLRGNHAEHIHQNCDCTFAIAFKPADRKKYDNIYDPQKYKDLYYSAEGDTPRERINYIRRGLERRTTNPKPFEQLTELMTLKHVKNIMKDMEVDMRGAKIKIDRNIDMLGKGIFGHTSDDGKIVTLYPDAFQNREELVKTIGHESVHLLQIEKDGKVKSVEDLISREEEASASENEWWGRYVKKTGYRSK